MVGINVLPLGSYDILIRMDWPEQHAALINYLEKIITYVKSYGKTHTIHSVPKPISVRQINSQQMKRSAWKGCQISMVQLKETRQQSEELEINVFRVNNGFYYFFPKEIPILQPHWDLDFSIDMVSGAALVSRAPY